MFEKSVITILKGFSAVIYVLIMLTLFSIPVLFIWQAVTPPVFTLNAVEITENAVIPETAVSDRKENEAESSFGDDALAEDVATDEESWTRIDFFLTAEAGKISPYSYMIDCFVAEENELLKDKEYELILDEPISFDNKTGDDFTLSLYIKEDIDIEKLCQTISFKAEDYEKSFAEFSLKW